MTSELVVAGQRSDRTFAASLEAEEAAERGVFRSIFLSIVISGPILIVFFLGLMALAISDKTDWYVWIGLGVGAGLLGAGLFGLLAGVTLAAHKLDVVDQQVHTRSP